MRAPELPRTDRRASRILLIALLALAHVGLGIWLSAHRGAAPRQIARPASLLQMELSPQPPRVIPPPPATALPAPRLPLPVIVPIEPPRIEIATTAAPTQPPSPEAANAAASARPAPLNLALPSAAPAQPASAPQPYRNPALSDPRANTRRADFGTRMADTLGTDNTLREESLGPGRHRFKQGTSCVETAQSRIAQIDPMGETMRGSPQLVTDCK